MIDRRTFIGGIAAFFSWLSGSRERTEAAQAFSAVLEPQPGLWIDEQWPEGKGPPEYDFYSPMLLNSTVVWSEYPKISLDAPGTERQ